MTIRSTPAGASDRVPLRRRLQEVRGLYARAPEAVVVMDNNRVIDCNPAATHLYGFRRKADFMACHPRDLSPPVQPDGRSSASAAAEYMAQALRDGVVRCEWTHRRADGTSFPAEVVLVAFALDGRPLVRAVMRDLTEEKRAAAELQASEERFRNLAEAHPVPMLVTSATEDRFLYISEAGARVFGLSRAEMAKRSRNSFWANPADREQGLKVLQRDGGVDEIEVLARRADGSLFPAILSGRAITYDGKPAWIAAVRDVTQQKRMEEDLARQREALEQSAKMAAMGSLLAGVSHELNNPLAIVMAQAELLLELARDPALAGRARTIHAAAERCARIVRTFLALARAKPPAARAYALNDVVAAAVELLAYGLRTSGIALTQALAADLPALFGDADQVAQVVSNLIVNAQQAMQQHDGIRRLTLTTRRLPEGTVELAIADTGPGVPAAIRARVFEPFFTTKPVGSGTGIGLAMCHSIIAAHGGTIGIEDAPGGGALFVVRLPQRPVTELAAESAPAEVQPVHSDRAILVVDDEPELLSALADILMPLAGRIDRAGNGREALALLATRRYDAILSDLRMPDMDGPALHAELTRRDPAQAKRLIFVTGDALGAGVAEFLRTSGAPVIEKPFTAAEVRRVVGQALEG